MTNLFFSLILLEKYVYFSVLRFSVRDTFASNFDSQYQSLKKEGIFLDICSVAFFFFEQIIRKGRTMIAKDSISLMKILI